MSSHPAGPAGPTLAYPVPRARRRRWRRPRTVMIAVIAVIGLLAGADFGARALAEDRMAAQIQSQGFPKKPAVSIAGFPFLTQLISRDFRQISLRSGNVPEGPVTIKSVSAVLNGVRVSSGFSGATVSRLTGTVFITFPELASGLTSQAGGLGPALGGAGLTLTAAGRDEVRTSVSLPLTSGSATWRVARLNGTGIDVRLVTSSGLLSGLGGSIGDIRLPLPSLPLGVRLQSLSVTPNGVVGRLAGQNLSFGG